MEARTPETTVAEDGPLTAAEVYDKAFVPALFAQWGPIVTEVAGVARGDRVLDVATGTGVLACAAAKVVGAQGRVVGVDCSGEMLAVARRKSQQVRWVEGRAEALPFDDASFDRVVSQFALMLFDDRVASLREAKRVLRPGGGLTVAVCGALDHSPGYAVLAELLHRLFGHAVAEAFRAPFALGDRRALRSLFAEAGLDGARVARHDGTVRFGSIADLVSTERACVFTLGGLLDDAQFERLLEAANESLQPFVQPDGTVAFAMPALLVTATKTGEA
jgi:ubiquinone/menaquinone biosynthesis C-methylase UbiE